MKRVPLLMACTAALACSAAYALDLGRIGPTYGIAEPNLLADIERRLREKERSGELRRLMDEARTRSVAAVRDPRPVQGLKTAESSRTFYVDPSLTLDRNIVDASGRLLFPAGTRKNPLEVVSLSRRLLFFDGRDPRQVRRARQLMAGNEARIKPILIGGSYLELMKSWRVPVYYDQQGVLTRRLGIRQVPALVSQDGLRLRIDEMVVR
jgi:conjugal transfer pilus assembly protein TraW